MLVNHGSYQRVGEWSVNRRTQTTNRRSVHRLGLSQNFWAEFLGVDSIEGCARWTVSQATVRRWPPSISLANFVKTGFWYVLDTWCYRVVDVLLGSFWKRLGLQSPSCWWVLKFENWICHSYFLYVLYVETISVDVRAMPQILYSYV